MPRIARGPEGAAEAVLRPTGEPEAPLEAAAAAAGEFAAPPIKTMTSLPETRVVIRQQAIEVQHEARAARGFGGEHGIHAAGADVDAARGKGQCRVRQVEGDAGRVVDGERHRFGGRRRVMQRELHLLPGDVLDVD